MRWIVSKALGLVLFAAMVFFTGVDRLAAAETEIFDVIIRGGTIYDGSGGPPIVADLAIKGDRIAGLGDYSKAAAKREIDAAGKAVSPGFINMLSWAVGSLMVDGRAMSDLKQGVTLEVFGEGFSWGPLNPTMKAQLVARQGDLKYDVTWTTLGEYLETLEKKGVSPNVASFVGATSVRIHEIGYQDRPPTAAELARMQDLVRAAMREGALGVGSSLIYAPANFADTAELTALAKAAGEFGGMYISHIRSEGNRFEAAVDELISIAREAGVPAEIYHLKASGKPNWGKLERIFEKVEAARAAGIRITADMYNYPASATGLDAAMPLWVQEGGLEEWIKRLKDPVHRARVVREMRTASTTWENRFIEIGPDKILLTGFKNKALRPLIGKTVAEVAKMRGISPEDAAIDLVIEDGSRVDVVYFSMNPANLHHKIRQPWVSFGSDAGAPAAEGVFLSNNVHPRTYGNFARLLAKYVREEKVISLAEAVRRITSLPAGNLSIRGRGHLKKDYYADVVVFDPETVQDHATFEKPHQYATGVLNVFINGVEVLKDGEHTGATPGRVVRGPGWEGWGRVGLGCPKTALRCPE